MTWLFWGAVALISYTYFGYPAWLWLRGLLRPRPVHRASCLPFVSIVMVVRNEETVLEQKLRNLLELNYPEDLSEIIVVADGCSDGSNHILSHYAQQPRVHAMLNLLSRGKAAGLNDAAQFAHGDVIVFTDARQLIEPEAVRLLGENFADPSVGCVSGELMLGNRQLGESSEGVGLYWKVEKTIRELESRSGSVIGATGALYAVRRELLVPVPPETILDDVYIPMHVLRQGRRVVFDGRARAWERPSDGTRLEFARKVRTLRGNYQLLQLAPWLLSGKNPARFELVSHKLLRLIVPFALLAALIASMFLHSPVYRAALAVQIGFYALSLLAMVRPKMGVLSRMADAAFTFVILNTAGVVAFAGFVTRRKVTWGR